MTVQNLMAEIKQLSQPEQAALFDELVQLVDPATAPITLTPAQAADLDRRIDEYRAGKVKMIPGDEAFAHLRARK